MPVRTVGRLTKLSMTIVLVVFLCGCAGKRGGNWLGVNTPQDIGPLPSNYKEIVTLSVKSQLKDPYSAVINVKTPYRASCNVGIYGLHYGWAVPVLYNAKNSFGAYTGERMTYFWFSNGRMKRVSSSPTFCP